MNKTIFNLNYKTSLLIVSIVGIILGFLSNAFYVGGLLDFIFYVFRFGLFIALYLVVYICEKNNLEFKESSKRMIGYLTVSSSLNLIFSVFVATHLLKGVFITLSGVVCLCLILTFLIEILNVYFNNKFIGNIYNVNKKIGLAFANPIIKLFNK